MAPRLVFRAPRCEPEIASNPEITPAAIAHTPAQLQRNLHARKPTPHAIPIARPTVRAEPVDYTAAQRFAEQVLRLTLEVLDRRRPPNHLAKLLAPSLIDTVRALALTGPPGAGLGVAQLRRIHLRPEPSSPLSVELMATYRRGPRTLVAAGQIRRGREAWRVESLQFG